MLDGKAVAMPRADYPAFSYRTPPELSGGTPSAAPVAIIGAGPVGLALAIDLALHGVKTIVLDDNNTVSVGSRAICWAKRTLEIFGRLGVGERMVKKGVTWKVGRLFHGEEEVWNFDLLPEEGHKNPAFINLQQYHVEQYLVERCADFPDLIDLRWKNKVAGVSQDAARATLTVQTPDGAYDLAVDYVVACDGARSPTRAMMGLEFQGRFFEERFLIADVEMKIEQPSERWFWFEPTFHSGQSALLHKQPDNIYRIDLQLGPDADPELEKRPERVIPRIEKAVGHSNFELDWVSVYTFQCRRLERFVHERVIFAGDSAHVVSPFGARGGNGGIQDADNLGWKLAAVVKGEASAELLESYNEERVHGADENILNSSRATNFMSAATPVERLFRDEVLALAKDMPFARRLINSGRLSQPCSLAGLTLQTPCVAAPLPPGSPCLDAPVRVNGFDAFLLDHLGGEFIILTSGEGAPNSPLRSLSVSQSNHADLHDVSGLVAARYGRGWTYLIRPDQHVAAAWQNPSAADIAQAHSLAMVQSTSKELS
jgi:3-(3-hydroxy-phenyl)propionate hydroxylase